MPRRPNVGVATLRERWHGSPLLGGLLGIVSVAVATGLIALACGVIALIVAWIY